MSRVPSWVWIIVVVVIAAAFAIGVLWGRGAPDRDVVVTTGTDEPTGSVEPTVTDGSDITTAPALEQTVRVYFARGDKLGVVLRDIPATKSVATAAMQELLKGTTEAEEGLGFHSEVPAGTLLRGVTVSGGTASVDLSEHYDDGGGTLSVTMRLAQVVYTLTQFPTVQRVEFFMNGVRVSVFSGEGVVLDRPSVRPDFEYVLPAIFPDGPTPGEEISSPLRTWGTANTFEAAFMVRLEDANGNTVQEWPAMATSGTGTRGTFDLTLPYTRPATSSGTVVFYESSAKDGSEINIVRIPVLFVP